MCGRFHLSTSAENLVELFDVKRNELGDWKPCYNIAPTMTVAIIREHENERIMSGAHWGLVPFWADEKRTGFSMINARAETVAEKRSFKDPIRKSRCIVPADGWFEWREEGGSKQPYHFHLAGNTIAPFAGICTWNEKLELLSCSIIVTEANPVAAEIHDRMPVILGRHAVDQYLDHETELDDVLELLRPYSGNDLEREKVSRKMSNPKHQGPECVEPMEGGGA